MNKKDIVDRAVVRKAIKALFARAPAGTVVRLCSFPEKGSEGPARVIKHKLRKGQLNRLVQSAIAEAEWAASQSVPYVFCIPGATFKGDGGKTEDAASGLVLSLELDHEPRRGRKTIERLLGPATMCVLSGGKYRCGDRIEDKLHLHYVLDAAAVTAEAKRALREARDLAADLAGGDGSNRSIVHAIRCPGSVHRKKPKASRVAKLIEFHPEKTIKLTKALKKLQRATLARPTPSKEPADKPTAAPPAATNAGLRAAVERILAGEDYHASLTSAAMHCAMAGMSATSTGELLLAVMNSTPKDKRDVKDGMRVKDRWRSRIAAIPRLVASAIEKVESQAAWQDPQPLPVGLPPVPALAPEALPKRIRPWAVGISKRMQTPLDYVACAAITAAGAALGSKVGIAVSPAIDPTWIELPNVWCCIIGNPGVMKSPSMRTGLAPLQALEDEAAEVNAAADKEHKRAMEIHNLKKKVAEDSARKALRSGGPDSDIAQFVLAAPSEPIKRRYLVHDATPEALAKIVADNPDGVLIYRDELVPFLVKLEDDRNAELRALLLSGWSSRDAYSSDRIGRGHTGGKAYTLSVLGSTQPRRFSAYLRGMGKGKSIDDGMLQRFGLTVWPDIPPGFRQVADPKGVERAENMRRLYRRLNRTDPRKIGATTIAGGSLPVLRFEPEAQKIFDRWHAKLERRVRGGDLPEELAGQVAKYKKLIPALALLFHIIDKGGPSVSLSALKRAMSWAPYLEAHARRVYAGDSSAAAEGANQIIKRIEEKKLTSPFTERDLRRRQWQALTDPKVVNQALQLLWDCHVVRRRKEGGKYVFDINPAVTVTRKATP